MKDFTLKAYAHYINIVKKSGLEIMSFHELLSFQVLPKEFFVIRHDVDRKPKNALSMAILESEMGIKSTYYFRSKSHTFNPEIISSILELGHDIGYHYECLSDSKGDIEKAIADFDKTLEIFRLICEINTVSMHGRPLSPFNNLDMWKDNRRHKLIKDRFKLLGEITLDIDYTDIAYISDTGRNWNNNKNNLRDHVRSKIALSIRSYDDLVNYLINMHHRKIIFQIHPERWCDNWIEWQGQLLKDIVSNSTKGFIRNYRDFQN
jgi:hypothetical protein